MWWQSSDWGSCDDSPSYCWLNKIKKKILKAWNAFQASRAEWSITGCPCPCLSGARQGWVSQLCCPGPGDPAGQIPLCRVRWLHRLALQILTQPGKCVSLMFWRWRVQSQHWITVALLVPRGKKTEHILLFTSINRAPRVLFLPASFLQSVCSWCSLGFVGAAREEPRHLLVPGPSEVPKAQVFSAGHGVWPVLRRSSCGSDQSSQQLCPLSGNESCSYHGEHSGLTTELWVLWAHEVMKVILELSRE